MTTFTLSRHIIEEQRKFPGATGRFSELLAQIAVAAKIVSNEVNKAGLAEILGATGGHNVFGEEVQKLDVFARNMFFSALDHTGLLCVMGSEEDKGIVKIPEEFPIGSYVFLYDPLDGSSNIDVNVSIGTIFSIFNKISDGKRGTLKDCLQPGYKQICSGYVIYGSSTMLVYSTGQGVHGFTLDPAIGEFLLSNYDMKFPPKNKSKKNLSINMGNYNKWDKATQKYVDDLTRNIEKPYRSRYIGSLVADFHRNLLHGGIFLYPGNYKKNPENPQGKLRLLYEASPLAFLAEQAGGRATTGKQDILKIQPKSLHHKVPLIIGSKDDVDMYEKYVTDIGQVEAHTC